MKRQTHTAKPYRSLALMAGLYATFMLAACGSDETLLTRGMSLTASPALAVIHSDYSSASISLVDPTTGALAQDDCINSGSALPAPALALAADLQIPSHMQPNRELLVIDRTNSTLTWVDPTSCRPARQMSVSTGFNANPQDAISISATKMYVPRSLRNEAPTNELDGGDDILIVDPSTNTATGRIALGGYATPVEGVETLARPGRAVRVEDMVYVTLDSSTADYRQAGEGRVAVIDTLTDSVVETIDIPGLKGCQAIAYERVEGNLLLGCGGVYADGPDQALRSGIVQIDIEQSPPAIVGTLEASHFDGRSPSWHSNIVATGPSTGAVLVPGVPGGTPTDSLWYFDFDAESATSIASSDESFDFSLLAFHADSQTLYIGDASDANPRLRSFAREGDGLIELDSFNSNPSHNLPPRYMGWF